MSAETPHINELGPVEDLEDLYENAPCGYLSIQQNGLIVKVNATLCGWLGLPVDQVVGQRFHELLNVGGRIFYETHFAPLLRMQGFFNEVALELAIATGDKLPVIANAVERRNPAGDVLFTRITIFRATDRRKYERELVAMRTAAEAARQETHALNQGLALRITEAVAARLQAEQGLSVSQAQEKASQLGLMAEREAAELRDQFIAVLGHDLRNPLAALTGGTEILGRQINDEKGMRVLGLMRGSIDRMANLITDVLDFARGRLGGGISLEIKPVDLGPMLAQVVSELRLTKPSRLIETAIYLPDALPLDPSRFGQLLSNLLGNALTYGAVDKPVRINAFVDGYMLEVSVANAGEPIPDASLRRLFQPFFRGEDRPNRQGLGLGLHIASEIAIAHKGILSVSSSVEETRFTFRMPLRQVPSEGALGMPE